MAHTVWDLNHDMIFESKGCGPGPFIFVFTNADPGFPLDQFTKAAIVPPL